MKTLHAVVLCVGILCARAYGQPLLSTQPKPQPQPPQKTGPGSPSQPQAKPLDSLARAKALFDMGNPKQALAILDRTLDGDSKNIQARAMRAGIRESIGLGELARQDYDVILMGHPKDARALHQRGWLQLTLGNPVASVADFDRALELNPGQRPHHWQRGIACYYAEKYEEGRKQFELHQTVNSQDVENAVWHFLCVSKLEGVEKARHLLIQITGDPRVPLKEVQALFAGKGTEEAVLNAAKSPGQTDAKAPLFYAHLYLALYYEAIGKPDKSREHMLLAATDFSLSGPMGDVARAHRLLREKKR